MPPIYHSELSNNALSRSVFETVKEKHPDNGVVLNVTYRMNDEITAFVGSRYYAPHGISLVSAENSVGNHYLTRHLEWRSTGEPSIEYTLCECPGACDENTVEAERVVQVVEKYLGKGLTSSG